MELDSVLSFSDEQFFWRLLGTYASERRQALGLSKGQVAHAMGNASQTIEDFEQGYQAVAQPEFDRLSEVLGFDETRLCKIAKLAFTKYLFEIDRDRQHEEI